MMMRSYGPCHDPMGREGGWAILGEEKMTAKVTIHNGVSDWGKQAHRWDGAHNTLCGIPCGWNDGPQIKLLTGWVQASGREDDCPTCSKV